MDLVCFHRTGSELAGAHGDRQAQRARDQRADPRRGVARLLALAVERERDGVGQHEPKARPVHLDLVVGTRPDLGLSWLFPQVDRLTQRLPHVTIHLFFGATDDLFARLRTREIDCAVTSAQSGDPQLDAIGLHREDLVFVAAPALLRRQPFTRPDHARHHVLVDVSPGLPLFRYWRDAEGGGDLAFARVLRFNSLAAIHDTVVAGRGVAVLPRYFVARALGRRRLRRLFPRVALLHDQFRLVYRRDDDRVDTYRALAALLVRQPLA
jgi:DNA-binding transcriptional LysR family regulator